MPVRNPFIDDEAQEDDSDTEETENDEFLDNSQSGAAGSRPVDRDDRPQHQPSLLTTFQKIIDAYSTPSLKNVDTDPSESDIEGSDSEDESDTEEDTAQTVRATAEELAERTDIGMVRFTVRSGSKQNLIRRIQRISHLHHFSCDFWIARGAGSCRYLYVLYFADLETTAEAKLAKVNQACKVPLFGNSKSLRAFNLEDDKDRHNLSMASAFVTVCERVGMLPTLFDVRSALIIYEREDRVTTLLARARGRRMSMNWAGKWVVIQGGEYHGDVGFVRAGPEIHWDWLSSCRGIWVDVLVVPRVFNDPALRDYGDSLNENGKRRPASAQNDRGNDPKRLRTEGDDVKRLEPHLLADRRGLTVTSEGRLWQVYEQLGDRVFATDLAVIRMPAKKLTLALMTPFGVRQAFKASENVEIDKATLPPPSICTLEEDERIVHRPSRWVGYMVEWRGDAVLAYNVVDGVREERILPMAEINKYFDLGEYVEVIIMETSTETVAGAGWVIQNIHGALLQLFHHRSTPHGHTGEIYDIDPNFCRATTAFWKGPNAILRHVPDVPHSVDTLTKHPQKNLPPYMLQPEYYTGVIPWKGLNVIVTGKHRFKGQRANVVDVNITPGTTKSGLRISVVMYNSVTHTSFKENLDYADVLDERTGWPLRVANPISPRHVHAGFCGDRKDWHKEMVQHFGQTFQERDIRCISPPSSQFDTAGGGASAAGNITTPEDSWICRDFLIGVAVQVFRKTSMAAKPKSIPVVYHKIGVFQTDVEKDRIKGKVIPFNDVVPQHPGRWPAQGKCWMVLEGPWQGIYVRPIQFKMWSEQFEGPGEKNVPHWEVFEVTRDRGQADVPTNRRLLIRDEHLIVLADTKQQLRLNQHLISYKVGSRVEDAQDPWTIGPDD